PGADRPDLRAGFERVPVEAQGPRWGLLTALPGPPHPAGRRTVLELGAFALALGRLADSEGEQWLQLGSKRVFETLLGGRYRTDAELATQLSAAGLPLEGRAVFAATLRGTDDFGAHPSLERAIIETALRRAVAPRGRVLLAPDDSDAAGDPEVSRALHALISLPGDDRGGHGRGGGLGAAGGTDHAVPAIAVRLAHELDMLVPGPTPSAWRMHLALGAPERRLRQLVASLEQLRVVGRLTASAETGRVTVQQVERQPLAHLIRGLAGRPELQQFADDALGPLVEHDATAGPGHSGDLLQVLAAYLANPSNRSLAASRARLSRSVFYQRLTLIEDLLGVDLADGETIATLAVALLARQR
ncbi:MAG: helix-turn-helix domain-containing protein, partial [Actinobacteria bacterium]|nr:helix-turn-helix domain-containing protein [Actinomycetota bacterium]